MVIAVDFDGTLVKDAFPGIGAPNYALASALLEMQQQGHKVILWTCRHGALLEKALDFCWWNFELRFDGVNCRPDPDPDAGMYPEPEGLERYRKVFADIYIDDRAMTPENFILVRRIFEKGIDKSGEI